MLREPLPESGKESIPGAENLERESWKRARSGVVAKQRMVEVHCIAELAAVRHDLGTQLQTYSLPAGVAYDLLTCVQEASMNALLFGATPWGVRISLTADPNEILITVRDHGSGLDLKRLTNPPPAPMSEAGRGLFLLRTLMDRVEFRVQDGTEVRLHKLLPPRATTGSHAA